jgi:CHAT domain-containing protein/tetratricopeptide (TPR) repeat protein
MSKQRATMNVIYQAKIRAKAGLRVVLACALCGLAAALANGQAPPVAPLALGPPVERALQTGEPHLYQATLAAGEYLNLVIAYQGLSLAVTLNGPDGQPVAVAGGTPETMDSAEIAVIAPAAGTYQLRLSGRGTETATGKYQLAVKAWRAATERDQQAVVAQRLYLEAEQLYYQQTSESRRQALAKFEAALPSWRAAANPAGEAKTLRSVGLVLGKLGESAKALAPLEQARTLARAGGDREAEAEALLGLGRELFKLGKVQPAREHYSQLIEVSRAAAYRNGELHGLIGFGQASAPLGRAAALESYQQAMALARELGDRQSILIILNELANLHQINGEPDQAIAAYQQALALINQGSEIGNAATLLFNLGATHFSLNQFQPALDYEQRALALYRQAGNRSGESLALMGIGNLNLRLGEVSAASQFLQQSLEISLQIGNQRNEAIARLNLGLAQLAAGQAREALAHYQKALAIYQAGKDRRSEVSALTRVASAWFELRDLPQAQAGYQQAYDLSREIQLPQSEARALLGLGQIQQRLGDLEGAAQKFEQARALAQATRITGIEAESLRELARLALARNQPEAATAQLEAALKLIEKSRSGLVSVDLRSSYRSTVQNYYELQLEALVRQFEQQHDNRLASQALEAFERAQARGLLELLNEAQADIRQGVAADLLKRESDLQQQLARKADQQAAANNNAEAATIRHELTQLTDQLRQVETLIRQASPAYAALARPEPVTLRAIQQQLLDEKTLLLAYALGAERSFLFAVTPSALDIFVLPKRADIETAAQEFRARLTRYGQPHVFHSPAERQAWLRQTQQAYQAAGQTLSRLLLEPVRDRLGHKRLLIVGGSVLQMVPFAALPEPSAPPRSFRASQTGVRSAASAERPPLVVKHEILNLPSLSTLAALRQAGAGRAPAPLTIALLADPVFDSTDERVKARLATLAPSAPQVAPSTPTRSFDGWAENTATDSRWIARLPATRQEAEAVRALVPESKRLIALDFAANRALATSAELRRYRYVHFATHGLLDSTHPELSGLALSRVDEQGRPQDGYLRTLDVFKLKLNAELVVLSGCRTGLGKTVLGEGLVGLTQGFLYAGAQRVLASQWQVNDDATAELMKRFYLGMLGRQQLPPAAALRAAQLQLLRQQRFKAPYYWAAFVLQGKW